MFKWLENLIGNKGYGYEPFIPISPSVIIKPLISPSVMQGEHISPSVVPLLPDDVITRIFPAGSTPESQPS